MKKALLAILMAALFATLSFAHSGKHAGDSKFTKHFHDTLFAISDKGQVSIEILLDEKEYKIGGDMIGIVIHDSHDEDVESAKVTVTVTGVSSPLKVNEKGGGLYLLPNAALPKEGRGQMVISVKTKKVDDSAAFDFPEMDMTRMPAGKYDAGSLKQKKQN